MTQSEKLLQRKNSLININEILDRDLKVAKTGVEENCLLDAKENIKMAIHCVSEALIERERK